MKFEMDRSFCAYRGSITVMKPNKLSNPGVHVEMRSSAFTPNHKVLKPRIRLMEWLVVVTSSPHLVFAENLLSEECEKSK